MPASSLLALIDDIATILDDVSTMSKVALEKTAGVVGDDLALNAKQIMGVRVQREIPIVWAVAKGSLINKLILVPAALVISMAIPWAVMPLLMLGGLYLCFEGVEKILHQWLHKSPAQSPQATTSSEQSSSNHALEITSSEVGPDPSERAKIQGAIRTDFILSAEIIVIALGTIADASLTQRILVLCTIALLMTIGVYGLVAAILKLDDAGLALQAVSGNSWLRSCQRKVGRGLVWLAPYLMKTLGIAGTIAMFLVGGGIVVHGIPPLHHWLEHQLESIHHTTLGNFLHWTAESLFNLLIGVSAGLIIVAFVSIAKKLWFGNKTTSLTESH